MLKVYSAVLETDVVADVDKLVSENQRSNWIRGAMRLRLVLEDLVADDTPITDAMIRQALGLIESPVIA